MQECIAMWGTFKRDSLRAIREGLLYNYMRAAAAVCVCVCLSVTTACLVKLCMAKIIYHDIFKIFIVSIVLTIKYCVMLFQLPDEVCIW